jgi:hypothetical protein
VDRGRGVCPADPGEPDRLRRGLAADWTAQAAFPAADMDLQRTPRPAGRGVFSSDGPPGIAWPARPRGGVNICGASAAIAAGARRTCPKVSNPAPDRNTDFRAAARHAVLICRKTFSIQLKGAHVKSCFKTALFTEHAMDRSRGIAPADPGAELALGGLRRGTIAPRRPLPVRGGNAVRSRCRPSAR